MYKRFLALLIVICCVFCGCAQPMPEGTESPETKSYIIPQSLLKFLGSGDSDWTAYFTELGSDFCTSATETPEGIRLELTDAQLHNFIARNDELLAQAAEEFSASNSMYKVVLDDSYEHLQMYFDENFSVMPTLKLLTEAAGYYGLNYVLLNNTTEWNVKLDIYNCHTNKLVVSVNMPKEKVSFGAAEWAASYE